MDHKFDAQTTTVGERLRSAREEKGLSLEDVATRTRIPLRHLAAIEEERWDALPSITYSVGFARAYANAVGLDGAGVGRELRDQLGGTRVSVAVPEFYEPADPARVPPRGLAITAAVIAIVLVVGYLLWRSSLAEDEPVAAPAAPATAPSPAAAPAAVQPTASAPATGQVTLVAMEPVWLRISEGAGAALFQGTLNAGQRYDVPATAANPVIRTGRPQVLRVAIGGREIGPLDTRERTIGNVSLRPADLQTRLQPSAAAPVAPAAPATAGGPTGR